MAGRPFLEIPFEAIELGELIGGGRFGSVFKATWNDRVVAVKKTVCFGQEAELLASLRHKNIILFLGACTQAPNSFLVTEFAEYGSLYHFLEQVANMEMHVILQWALDIAEGMKYLHHSAPQRVIHRDLKSLNVLVCADGEDGLIMKICDFGSSRRVGLDTKTITSAGTVSWMAPEMIRNQHPSEKCDVWSFGVIVWELITLEVPYADLEAHSVMWLVATQGMSLCIPERCPDRMSSFLKSCMCQDPKQRPDFITIVKTLEFMAQDDELGASMQQFFQHKREWVRQIDKALQAFSSLEANAAQLERKRVEIESREAQLRLRETALLQQLQSQEFALDQPTPNTPHELMANSVFSDNIPSKSWTVDKVFAWISILPDGLQRYADVFRDNHVNGRILLQLTDTELRNDLGMTSFGHRRMFLNHVRDIQRSMDFPPLEAHSEESTELSAMLEDKARLSLAFDIIYTHEKHDKIHVRLQPQQEDCFAYIHTVEFFLSDPKSPDTKTETCTSMPFEFYGGCTPSSKSTLLLKIKFKVSLFHRKTVKKSITINGTSSTVTFQVSLEPKQHFLTHPAGLSRQTSICSSTSRGSEGGDTPLQPGLSLIPSAPYRRRRGKPSSKTTMVLLNGYGNAWSSSSPASQKIAATKKTRPPPVRPPTSTPPSTPSPRLSAPQLRYPSQTQTQTPPPSPWLQAVTAPTSAPSPHKKSQKHRKQSKGKGKGKSPGGSTTADRPGSSIPGNVPVSGQQHPSGRTRHNSGRQHSGWKQGGGKTK
eukprot:m.15021 g.15021  ORF g.15021 m.15021 type:complete len:766 (+) comp6484_c0_seq1:258-2555(+)